MDLQLIEQSQLMQLIIVFTAGLATSLTPCVYPLIPITLAIFGLRDEIPRSRAFLLSTTYVLGISTTYTILGLIAASTGKLFGSLLGNPLVIILIVIILLLLCLYTLDLFNIPFLHQLQSQASAIKVKGFKGAFIMGALSGFVAAPCVGPALVAILAYVSFSQDLTWGAILLCTYSLGMGVLFILLGTFSSLISKLPKSGDWMQLVKFLIATTILVVALYLLEPLCSDLLKLSIPTYVFSLLVIAALALALVAYKKQVHGLKFIAALFLSFCIFNWFSHNTTAIQTKKNSELVWLSDYKQALQLAKSNSKTIMIDFYADWCIACKELDQKTFSNLSLRPTLKDLVLLRINLTEENSDNTAIKNKHNIFGLPLLLFLDSKGKEIPNSRIEEFIEADYLKKHIENSTASLSLDNH